MKKLLQAFLLFSAATVLSHADVAKVIGTHEIVGVGHTERGEVTELEITLSYPFGRYPRIDTAVPGDGSPSLKVDFPDGMKDITFGRNIWSANQRVVTVYIQGVMRKGLEVFLSQWNTLRELREENANQAIEAYGER